MLIDFAKSEVALVTDKLEKRLERNSALQKEKIEYQQSVIAMQSNALVLLQKKVREMQQQIEAERVQRERIVACSIAHVETARLFREY